MNMCLIISFFVPRSCCQAQMAIYEPLFLVCQLRPRRRCPPDVPASLTMNICHLDCTVLTDCQSSVIDFYSLLSSMTPARPYRAIWRSTGGVREDKEAGRWRDVNAPSQFVPRGVGPCVRSSNLLLLFIFPALVVATPCACENENGARNLSNQMQPFLQVKR